MIWNRNRANVENLLGARHAVRFAAYYRREGRPALAAYMLMVAADLRRAIA